jgi:hypothetical protein
MLHSVTQHAVIRIPAFSSMHCKVGFEISLQRPWINYKQAGSRSVTHLLGIPISVYLPFFLLTKYVEVLSILKIAI